MNKISELLQVIEGKKTKLDKLGELPSAVVKNLNEWYRVELTYTSNAIEGNTLSRAETALVVSDGITVAGKSIQEHLEASNHAQAWDWVQEKTTRSGYLFNERDLLELHQLILARIDETNAGRYRSVPVRIAGSRVILPNAIKVPDLMKRFFEWIGEKPENVVMRACEAHYRLVSIHPFTDGNGRTARLVMNLLLTLAGYPPIIVKKEDRGAYLTSLERGQLGGPVEPYYLLMLESLDTSLDIYLTAAGVDMTKETGAKLLKMGELTSLTGESVPTVRHWTKMGLLVVAGKTPGGYQLYDQNQIEIVKMIRDLQKMKRLSLEEIRQELVNL